jgi:NAD(P)-dependent dehydrogenase (short-subunit alcohol dehydrogenase family)
MLAVNLTGTFVCMQAALPDLLAAGQGRIVNIASTAAQRGYAYVSAYVAAKHGVLGLTRSLALELATKGITVNAVCPGYTDTDILRDSIANVVAKTGRSQAEALAQFAAGNPQGRIVQPREVADAVRWLVGDGASAITGQAISVSGGEVT